MNEQIPINFAEHEEGRKLEKVFERNPRLFFNICENIFKKQENFIDEGMSAQVFFVNKNQKRCVKIIKKEQEQGAVQSSTDREYEIQQRAYNKCKHFIPEPIASFTHEDGSEILFMSRVNGVTLKDVLYNGAKLPESFNYEVFFQKLSEYVDLLHDLNIHHRDLHAGNVMISHDTGLPWIIDFGAAKIAFSNEEDDDIYEVTGFGNQNRRLQTDNSSVKSLRRLMKGIT